MWVSPSGPPRLSESSLHLWRLALDVSSECRARLEKLLSPAEKMRAERFVHDHDRRHSTVTRAVLRILVGQYLGKRPEACLIESKDREKPFVLENGRPSPLRFSLSHSHGHALLGFTLNHEIGVDLEQLRPLPDAGELAKRYFSLAESREIMDLDGEQRMEGFLNCWTRKEAYVKARGRGLEIPLNSFAVRCSPGAPPELRSVDSANWSMHSFRPFHDFVAAVVVEKKGWELQFYAAASLL